MSNSADKSCSFFYHQEGVQSHPEQNRTKQTETDIQGKLRTPSKRLRLEIDIGGKKFKGVYKVYHRKQDTTKRENHGKIPVREMP